MYRAAHRGLADAESRGQLAHRELGVAVQLLEYFTVTFTYHHDFLPLFMIIYDYFDG